MDADTTMTTEETVKILSTMTNRDDAGRHFTERYPDEVIDELEARGLVEIDRPTHGPTGIDYSPEYWKLTPTAAAAELVEAYPEYWDADPSTD